MSQSELQTILQSLTTQVELIATTVLHSSEVLGQLQEEMKDMLRKDDVDGLTNVIKKLDSLVGFTEKKDTELTMMSSGIGRTNDELRDIKKDIKRIKQFIKMPSQ